MMHLKMEIHISPGYEKTSKTFFDFFLISRSTSIIVTIILVMFIIIAVLIAHSLFLPMVIVIAFVVAFVLLLLLSDSKVTF